MRYGRARFYADENIEENLIAWLRSRKHRVLSARELGFGGRDDQFQLQEARRRKSILLTNDPDFLNHRRFPFHTLRQTGVVVLRTERKPDALAQYGFMLLALVHEVGASGNEGLRGLKVELRGPRIILYANLGGKIRTDEIDISSPRKTRYLLQDA